METKKYSVDLPSDLIKDLIWDISHYISLINILDYEVIFICKYSPGLSKIDRYTNQPHIRINIPKNIRINEIQYSVKNKSSITYMFRRYI